MSKKSATATATTRPTRAVSPARPTAGPGQKNPEADFLLATKQGMGWKKAREVTDTGFQLPEIDDGKYPARLLSMDIKTVDDKARHRKVPVVEFRFKVEGDNFAGVSLRSSYWLCASDYGTEEDSWAKLFKSLQRLGYETNTMTPSDIPSVAKELNAAQKLVEVSVKNGTKGDGERKVTVYLNKLLDE